MLVQNNISTILLGLGIRIKGIWMSFRVLDLEYQGVWVKIFFIGESLLVDDGSILKSWTHKPTWFLDIIWCRC